MTTLTGEQPNPRKRVVIVRGGFAGLSCARMLASNPAVEITLIDKNNYQPVPASALSGGDRFIGSQ